MINTIRTERIKTSLSLVGSTPKNDITNREKYVK